MAHVELDTSGAVAVMTIDRPPANAMNVDLLDDLGAALARVADAAPAALVLAGREGVFSAGADLKEVPGYGEAEQRRMVSGLNNMGLSTYGLPFPVVAAVTGHAIAGGLVLALCSDHRVASSSGRYGLTEVKVGVPYPEAAIGVVRAELPPPAARQLALGSRLTGAEECRDLGVFDEVLPGDRVLQRALEVAGELAALPADVYAATKRGLRERVLAEMAAAAEVDPLLRSWVAAD